MHPIEREKRARQNEMCIWNKLQSFTYRGVNSTSSNILQHLYKELWKPYEVYSTLNFKCRIEQSYSPPQVFLGKGVLEICSKFAGEYPCWAVILIKLLCYFIEITLRHGCSPVNVPHIPRTSFYRNTYRGLLLVKIYFCSVWVHTCRNEFVRALESKKLRFS